jgi:hypothetical protein
LAITVGRLASILVRRREFAEAETAYREVLAITRKVYSSDNRRVATALSDLARALREQGKSAEAEAAEREAGILRDTVRPETRPITLPPTESTDSVKILSISPEQCVAGTLQKITVRVRYTLGSYPQGIIQLGFNLNAPDKFRVVIEQRIGRGRDEIELSATITPTAPAEGRKFRAYVNLSPDPHPSPWTPLAVDIKPIEIK